jgi:hypothetical protein
MSTATSSITGRREEEAREARRARRGVGAILLPFGRPGRVDSGLLIPICRGKARDRDTLERSRQISRPDFVYHMSIA